MLRGNLGQAVSAGLIATSVGVPIFTSLIGVGAKFLGIQTQQDEIKKQMAKQKAAQRRADLLAARRAAKEDARLIQQGRYQEALGRRKTTTYALYAVGGVAVAISFVFLMGAVRKRRIGKS